jgi:hypothetical protein
VHQNRGGAVLSSLSDDENDIAENKIGGKTDAAKFRSKDGLDNNNNNNNNDSDSDYEADKLYMKPPYKNSSLVQTKRSYRSESELAKTTSSSKTVACSNMNSEHARISEEVSTTTPEVTTTVIQSPRGGENRPTKLKHKSNNIASVLNNNCNNNNNSCSTNSMTLGSKLNKTHKSVSSLLTATSNANQQQEISNPYSKLQEINENFMNQSQFNLSQKKCNCALNETLIAELRKKLTVTENSLTDIRLEALSSVHQVDQLKEYLEKLKVDMMSLKSENQLLKRHIRETKIQRLSLSRNKVIDEHQTNESFLEYLASSECGSEGLVSDVNEESLEALNGNLSNNYFYSYSKRRG